MIKNLLLIVFTLFSLPIFGQTCVPSLSPEDSTTVGVIPGPFFEDTQTGGITLPSAIGCPYEFVFQVNVPPMVDVPGFGVQILDFVRLDETGALAGLPEGISYACNPPNCEYPTNSVGCLVLFGTPTANNTPGDYDIIITADVSLNNGQLPLNDLTFPGELLTDGGNYFLEVQAEPSDQTMCPVSVNNQHITPFEIALAPNPTYGTTTLTVDSERRNELTFQILNITGQILQSKVLQVEQGLNSFEVEVQDLPEGMYLYSLGNEEGVLTDRIMVAKEK